MNMLRKLLVGVLIAVACMLVACAGGETRASDVASGAGAAGSASSTDYASAAATTSEAGASQEAGEPVDTSFDFSLGFIGDLCLADNYTPMQYLASIGSTDISDGIDPRFIECMQGMDIMWANNEFVYSDRGEALEGKAWTFRSTPANVKYLHDLGIDIVGLANNHTFDYGEEAFLDTLDTLKDAGIPYTGAGRDAAEARGPVYQEIDGFKIAYVNASSAEYTIYTPEAGEGTPGIAWSYDISKFLEDIRTADAEADFVVALPHWGTEHSTWLIDEQLNGAHAFIDAGADAVIGAHTHILQGLEYYQGKPIFYSLGNFWFDDYIIDTCVAELHISGETDSGVATSGEASADAAASGEAASDEAALDEAAADEASSGNQRSLENAQVELIVHPGTQAGVYTAWADTPEERDRIFRYLESISINVSIDENGIVHEL